MTKRAEQTFDPADMPQPSNAMTDRIFAWLMVRRPSRRPPNVSAKLLALIVELHLRGMPYPPRVFVAKAIKASPFGLDAAINRALEYGDIRVDMRTADGDIKARTSVVQRKHYVPSQELLDAAAPVRPRQLYRRRVA